MEGILNPECPFSGSILKFTSIVKIKVVYFWFWFWFWFVVVVVDVYLVFVHAFYKMPFSSSGQESS